MTDLMQTTLTAPGGVDMALVVGASDEILHVLEESFDARLTVRGNRIVIEGNAVEVQQLTALFADLFKTVEEGQAPDTDSVRRSVELLRQAEFAPTALRDDVLLTYRGRAIRPKTAGQKHYVDAIRDNTVTFAIGPAGTGKTYLAVAKAVRAFQDRRIRRIILTRPAVEAGESLGFLPGTLNDKVDPYLRPLYDALSDMLGPDQLHRYLDDGTIEVAPLAYMRGRTLNDAYVILDEAQNTTEQQMKMFLTRLGFNTTMIITGDVTQVDLAVLRSGLATIEGILGGIDDIAFAHLDAGDVVRHELVGRIVEAYDRHDATRVRRNRGKESREDAR